MARLEVLIPSYGTSTSLVMTLTSLCAQSFRDFDVVVAKSRADDDQHEFAGCAQLAAVSRVLRLHGHNLQVGGQPHLASTVAARHDRSPAAAYVLVLAPDLLLEPDVIGRMMQAIGEERCGFVGCAALELSHLDEKAPMPVDQSIEFWQGRVEPEPLRVGSQQWLRQCVHHGANLERLSRKLNITSARQRKYRVAWVEGCVLFDAAKLSAVGGLRPESEELPCDPSHDVVLAQWRVMARFGGCGLIPSGTYRIEPTPTVRSKLLEAAALLKVAREWCAGSAGSAIAS